MRLLARYCAASCLVALLLLGACSLSLDGYAGPPIGDDDGGDALSFETGPDDTGPPDVDGAVDAPSDASVAFCETLSPAPTFCDDFERGSPQGPWDYVGTSAGGTVNIGPGRDGTELVCAQPAFTSSTAGANINRFFGQGASEVTFAFDLTVDAPPAQGSLQLMSIFIQIGGDQKNQAAVFLVAQAAGFRFARQTFPAAGNGDYTDDPIATTVLDYRKRRRVEMHLTLGGSPHAKVTADGVVAYEGPLYPFFAPGTSFFSAGVHYADPPSGPLTVHVDNVVIDLQ